MEPNDKNLYSIRYTIPKEAISEFVEGLRQIQEDMIEAVVESKATQGYPEARAVIDHIRALK